jgi:hypothetical protein
MILRSAVEDFTSSFNNIPGILAKLEYVSHLRDSTGDYFHWGLMRVHGETVARAAMQEVHQALFVAILRTPIATLVKDASHVSVRQ